MRTLDAIQLAIALSDQQYSGNPVQFICADSALCSIAAAMGLSVINPEIP
jgi:hypothetical protein